MSFTVEQAAIALDAYVKSWKPVIKAEINGDTSFLEAIDAILPAFDKDIDNKQAATEAAIDYFVAAKFLLYKTIYRFEPSFIEILRQTEDAPIYQSSLKCLPVNCFIVPLYNSSYLGLIISVEMVEEETRLSVIGLPKADLSKENSETLTLSIRDGETLSSAIEKWHSNYDSHSLGELAKTDLEAIQILTLAAQISYYLSAKNCIAKRIKIPKAKRPRRSNGTPLNLQEWDVGYRIGNKYNPDKISNSSISVATGTATPANSPRAHLRRAHWHHYWVGTGRTKREVRWIAPVWVNGDSDTIIPTEHTVVT